MFFDLRLKEPSLCWYLHRFLQQYHLMNRQEKKRPYNQHVLRVYYGTFTPLAFLNCLFYQERKTQQSWARLGKKLCFTLLKFSLLYLLNSRSVSRRAFETESDIEISHKIFAILKVSLRLNYFFICENLVDQLHQNDYNYYQL